MWVTVARGLDLRSRPGFWKNDRAAVCAVRTIQHNNLLFYLLPPREVDHNSQTVQSCVSFEKT